MATDIITSTFALNPVVVIQVCLMNPYNCLERLVFTLTTLPNWLLACVCLLHHDDSGETGRRGGGAGGLGMELNINAALRHSLFTLSCAAIWFDWRYEKDGRSYRNPGVELGTWL